MIGGSLRGIKLASKGWLAVALLLTACGGGGTSPAPTPFWTKQMGVAGKTTWGLSTATDASGSVYVTGSTSGGLDGNTLTGTQDFFLTKYDVNGNKLYTKQMGVAGAETTGTSMATDTSGNVYVTGKTYGGLDGNTLTGSYDFFLVKYDSTGIKQ